MLGEKKDPERYQLSFPFMLSQKRLELSYHLPLVFNHMKTYKHNTDGVMFTSAIAPYVLGTCDKM
jgi:mRNA guanylyltransferase